MKLAIMQPYFFPYLGYFSLIKGTDKFILLDDVQFIRHGWIERNRILKPAEGWQYINVPLVKHSRETLIKNIVINHSSDWKDQILRQIEHYKKAPFYNPTINLIKDCLTTETESITKLNKNILLKVCKYLGFNANIEIFTDEKNEIINKITQSDEWALNISKAMGATTYINPIGGMDIFDKKKFSHEGIDIKFLKNNLPEYKQNRLQFESGLSIIDVMMFNSPECILKMLDDYVLC